MKRTQRCIKLSPHQRGVDKKVLSKPEQALHSDGERGQMKEKEEREAKKRREQGQRDKQRTNWRHGD